ncbi:MAG: S-layer homology domain-containing protein [Lachnospiraceae bacterium]|nr:S-layer homology domain-containing protein [Lachnospiraceae bacterium]
MGAIAVENPTITAQENCANSETASVKITVPADTDVYFTTDGTEPTKDSIIYSGEFDVATLNEAGETVVVKAVAVQTIDNNGDVAYVSSEVVSWNIVFRSKVTAFSPTITASQLSGDVTEITEESTTIWNIANDDTVTMSITNPNDGSISKVLYTLDGTEPSTSATAIEYASEFPITSAALSNPTQGGTAVLKVVAEVKDDTASIYTPTMTVEFRFFATVVTAPEISFTPPADGGTKYANIEEVTATISTYTPSLKYFYTVDGTDPTSASNEYNGTSIAGIKAPSKAAGKVVLKAIAQESGGVLSEITTKEIFFKAADDFTLGAGKYCVDTTVTSESYLKSNIDTKDVELDIDEDGEIWLSIRFKTKQTAIKTNKDTISLVTPKLVNEDGSLTDLVLDKDGEAEWEYVYDYSSTYRYSIKKVTVPLSSISSDVTLQFANSKGVTENYTIALSSVPVLAENRTIDNSVMGYSITSRAWDLTYDGYRQQNQSFTVSLNSKGYSETRPMVYYYSTDDNEEISFDSETKGSSSSNSFLVKANFGTDSSSISYLYTKSDDPHTMNLRVKGYVDGLGWTDEISIPLKFNKRPLANEVRDANGTGVYILGEGTFSDGTTDDRWVIPYDTVFKVEEITDSTGINSYADKISGLEKVDGNTNIRVLNYKLEDLNGDKVKLLDSGEKEFNTGKVTVMAAEGFSPDAVSVYKINEAGAAVRLEYLIASNEMGYGLYTVKDDYPGGVYIVIAEAKKDMPTMSNGYYLATAKLKDSEDKFKTNEYAGIVDTSYSHGYSVLNIGSYSKNLYLPISNKDGEYVTSVYYYDYVKGKYLQATTEETYSIDGEKYVKLAKMPITTKKAYLNVYFTTSTGKTQYGTVEMDYSNAVSTTGIDTQIPIMTTATGATSYVNTGKATVSLSTASENAKIYYTVTSGATGTDPDTSNANQLYAGSFDLSTKNKEGEIFTIKAVTIKSGFITSEVKEYKITFQKEGMAAVTAQKPVIFAKYASGDAAENGVYTITITSQTQGTSVYFTTDGSEPSLKDGTLYTGKFSAPALTNGSATVVKAIAIGQDVNNSDIAETTIIFSVDWWDNIEAGKSYEVPVKMLNFADNRLLSMGNGALTGKSTLTVDTEGNKFLTVPFQRIDMGGVAGYLIDLWYFENEEAANASTWKDKLIKGNYKYKADGKIESVTIPLKNKNEKFSVGIESDYEAMGKQRATLSLDYAEVIKAVTGVEVEKEKQVDTPIINAVLNAAGDAMQVEISMPTASDVQDADIYYIISVGEHTTIEKSEGNKYLTSFLITKEQVTSMGSKDSTVNVYAVAVREGYTDSIINAKKLTFNTSSTENNGGKPTDDGEIDVTKDGKYWVRIDLYKASDDEPSMGNVAFDNNRQALIVTSGGECVIQIGSNPVKIDPYYSGLQEFQYRNAQGTYQLATALQTQEIKTTYNGKEYTFDYLKKFQFTIPNVTAEYIDVKVKVPYTVMDSVVGNGSLDARLKIDWSSLTVGEATDELYTNSSASQGEVSITSDAVDVTDSVTGIRLLAPENVLLNGATLKAEAIKEGDDYKKAEKALGEGINRFMLYNILTTVNGEVVAPSASVELFIPIPEEFEEERVSLYRINSDGTKTLVAGMVERGVRAMAESTAEPRFYVVKTDKLGLFALVENDEVTNLEVKAEEVSEKELFSDISDHWAKDYIKKAVETGLFSGISDTEFAPDQKMTRGMFVTVIGRIEGVNPKAYRGNKFSDVKNDDYFSSYVLWAAEKGIVSGMQDGKFAPDTNVTREQMAFMLAKYAEIKGIELKDSNKANFSDGEKISDWSQSSINALAKAGIISGRANGSFAPQETASRADVAVMLVRFMEEYMPMQETETMDENLMF